MVIIPLSNKYFLINFKQEGNFRVLPLILYLILYDQVCKNILAHFFLGVWCSNTVTAHDQLGMDRRYAIHR